jgi:hypothetical protein
VIDGSSVDGCHFFPELSTVNLWARTYSYFTPKRVRVMLLKKRSAAFALLSLDYRIITFLQTLICFVVVR